MFESFSFSRRAVATFTIGVALSLGAAACGNDDDTTPDTTAVSESTVLSDTTPVDTTPPAADSAADGAATDTAPTPDTVATTADSAATTDTAAPATGDVTTDSAPPDSAITPADTAAAVVAEGCPPVDGSGPKVREFSAYPPMCIETNKTYKVVMETTKGKIEIELNAAKAPKTVNSFVVLARSHYFDGIVFHRVVPGFVIQGGDPTGTGGGGPGYEFEDELPQAGEYKIGSVAMANAGPNTNGSQFFIITGANGAALPPNYSLFGEVVDGLDVVEAIDRIGQPDPNPPLEKVEMTKVTIEES